MYIIYLIENIRNRKKYIGQTTDFKNRIAHHFNQALNKKGKEYNCPLYKDIRKYGKNIFKVSVLCQCETQEIADILEDYFIRYYDSIIDNKKGYNQNYGGLHGLHSESTKYKMVKQKFQMGKANQSFNKIGEDSFAGKRVKNITLNVIYPTLRQCALTEYGDIKYAKQISKCCSEMSNRKTYKNCEYCFVDENDNEIIHERKTVYGKKKVIELNSQKIFPSIQACAEYFNLSTGEIRDRIYNRIKNDKYKNLYNFQIIESNANGRS